MVNKETTRFEGDVMFATSLEPLVYGTGSVTIEGDVIINGSATITGGVDSAHSSLSGLSNDDHLQYALLTGRTSGQILTGSFSASSNLTLRSTTNASKGSIILDETTVSNSSSTGSLLLSGGLSISNTTDAVSSINGGTFTTAGGMAIAKKLFVGTDLAVGGNITGSWVGSTISVQRGGTGNATLNTNSVLLGNGIGAIQSPTNITYTSNTLTLPILVSNDTTATTSANTGSIRTTGGVAINNSTDAISISNGGSLTTSGGMAVAKKLFVGSDLAVTGLITSGTWNGTTVTVPFGGTGVSTLNSNSLLVGNGNSAILAPGNLTFSSNTLTLPTLVVVDTTATTSSSTGSIRTSGGISTSNTTDATSSTNGGSFTTAGGLAVAKQAFVGTNLTVGGNLVVTGTAALPHSNLTGLSNDDHTQYTLLIGRTGGQILTGGTATNNNLTIRSTTNATKGSIIFDETTVTNSSSTGAVKISGGLSISNSTDAVSSTNGGTFTTAGGVAIAKKLFVGDSVSISNTLNMNSTGIINLATPINPTDAANKNYVDLAVQGLDAKASVTLATTISGTLATSFANGQVIDGITLITGNRILIKNQTSQVENGVYIVNSSGAPTRASDFNTGASVGGSFLFVERGTINADSGWVCTTDPLSDVVGTNTLLFTQFSGAGSITAGTGLTKSGNTLSVNSSQTQVTEIGTITTGTWNSSVITVPFGGTGSTSLNTNSVLLGNGTSSIISPSNITYSSNTLSLPLLNSVDTTTSTSSSTGAIRTSGGFSSSNTTDAISSTNGGTFTTAGGLAVAKQAFVGTNLNVGGNLVVTGTAALPHSNLTGLANDDHTQYTLLAGRIGGQILSGGTATGNNLTLRSTTDITKGSVIIDETTTSTSNITGSLRIAGGIGISNTTDATSSINGGTFTTAGGVAIAKKLFVGADVSISGNVVSGTWNATTITVPFGGTGSTTLNGNSVLLGNGISPVQSPTNLTFSSNILTLPILNSNDTTSSTNSTSGAIRTSGGISSSNSTDATSSSNGGSFTTAGGVAIAKKLFVGTDLSVSGNINTGTWNATTISVPFGGTGSTTLNTNSVLLGNGTSAIQSPINLIFGSNTLTLPKITSNDTTTSTSPTTGALLISGGLSISNTTDAVSSSNGGTFTTAGGLAISKKLFVGDSVSISNTLNMNSTRILNVGTPINPTDAVNKNYVDLAVQGLDAKASVTIATTTPGSISVSFSNGQVIDGVTLVTNFRILIKDQTIQTENGVYIVNSSGAPTRASDFNIGSSVGGAFLFVERGTINADSGWVCTSDTSSDIVGTNNLTFTQFSGAGSITAGTGLTKTGNTLSVNSSQTHVTAIGTLTTGTWNANIITVPFGGTGTTTLNSNSILLGNGTSAVQAPINLSFSSNTLTTPIINAVDTTASTTSSTGVIRTSGGISTSNTTDAISSINGGSFTTAGGLAIAKKLFVGTDLSVTGLITSGTWNGSQISVQYGGTGVNTFNTNSVLLGNGTSAVQAPINLSFSSNTLTTPIINAVDTTASTTSSTGAIRTSGGISTSNTTDAISSSNGGSFTTAGGLAVAKKLFIGTDLSVTGLITSGTWNGSQISVQYGGTGVNTFNTNSVLLGNGTSAVQAPVNLSFTGNSTLNLPILNVVDTTASTTSSTGAIRTSGGISTNNTTDAVSSTNGGSFTSAGGLAVAKQAFVGTNLTVGGNLIVTGTASIPHSGLSGLASDDHTQYTLLAGRSGGQILTGGSASGNNLTIRSTSNVTKGSIIFDETTVSTSSSTGSVRLAGGISISNVTDAISSSNGGTITTAGGVAIAKKLFVGTDLSVTGNITSGTWNGSSITVPFGGTGNSTLNVNSVLIGNGVSAVQAPVNLTYTSNTLTLPLLNVVDTTSSTSSTTGAVILSGGLGISETDDAVSSSNGGSITTAGGVAIAKKLFVGDSVSISNTLNMNSTKIINVATPTNPTDAANKNYVDLAVQGLDTKASVVVATTVNGTLSTSFANGQTVDGIVLGTGNRILIKDQTSQIENGVYIVNSTGSPTRSSDFNTGASVGGSFLFVERGTVNADSGWVCSSDPLNDIVSVNNLIFTQFSGAGSITAGTGLTKSGNTLSVNNSQTQITAIGTITTGTWNSTSITVPFGGTGISTFNNNSLLIGNGTSAINSPSNLTFASNILATPRINIVDTTSSTSSSIGSILVSGGISINNVTDAVSSSNGGTITTAGGMAIAKKLFIGTDLSVSGIITSGTWNATTITVPYGGTGSVSLNTNSVLLGNGTSSIQAPTNITYSSNILSLPIINVVDTTASTSNTTGAIRTAGGIGITNITDATSSINGGSFTTAGGLAVAKQAFIGTNLLVGGNSTMSGNVNILGNLSVTGAFNLSHSSLLNLTNDDHTQYALLAGRSSGQTFTSGTGAGNNLTLRSTTNATKGSIIIDEITASTSSISGALRLSGGLGISNTTDAVSSTNGGSFTTAGGLAIAKQLFVGTNITTGSINVTNSTQNIVSINCQNSTTNPGRILFTNSGGTGDFIINGDGGDVAWQGGGGRALQMGAFHEIRLLGGRTVTSDIPFIAGSNATFNTIIQNTTNSIGLRIQGTSGQTSNLTQWTTSGGTILSSVDSSGNFTLPIANLTNYIQMASTTVPSNPGGAQFRYYTDSSDGLFKSRNSSGTVTIYQPLNTKGDISTHDGTTAVRLPVSVNGSTLVADSTSTAGISWNTRAYAYIRDEKTAGTQGGTFNSGAWVTRTLNTSTFYPSGQTDITLTGNIISLDPGIYKVHVSAPANRVAQHTSRILDNVTNAVLLIGSVVGTGTGTDVVCQSTIDGIITVPDATTLDIRIEHRCTSSRTTTGLGIASGLQTEVYTQVIIEKF